MDDQDYVEGMIAGRDEVVAAFLERYRPLLVHCIASFEPDTSAREDLEQELVCTIIGRLRQGRFDASKGSFGTWLYRVAWCRCVDLKRKERSRRQPLVQASETLPERVDESPGPGEVAGSSEIGERVRRAMSELEPEERALIELRFIHNRTLTDIAEELEITLEQTKYRLRRAQSALRRVLLRRFSPLGAGEP